MTAPQLLGAALEEIRSLRRVCERQQAQLEVVEVFKAALLGPPRPQPMSPDITQEIAKYLTEYEGRQ
jgi:hypothetical protein